MKSRALTDLERRGTLKSDEIGGRPMKGLVMAVSFAALIALTVAPVRYGTYDVRFLLVVVLVAVLTAYWLGAVIELLRQGPGEQRDWWLATLAVVVFLGPLGALAYRVASPRFVRDETQRRSVQH